MCKAAPESASRHKYKVLVHFICARDILKAREFFVAIMYIDVISAFGSPHIGNEQNIFFNFSVVCLRGGTGIVRLSSRSSVRAGFHPSPLLPFLLPWRYVPTLVGCIGDWIIWMCGVSNCTSTRGAQSVNKRAEVLHTNEMQYKYS
jgi:hypothetical protein